MADENLVRNLQNKYGYYIDRKMWSDVTDLFSGGARLTVADVDFDIGPVGSTI